MSDSERLSVKEVEEHPWITNEPAGTVDAAYEGDQQAEAKAEAKVRDLGGRSRCPSIPKEEWVQRTWAQRLKMLEDALSDTRATTAVPLSPQKAERLVIKTVQSEFFTRDKGGTPASPEKPELHPEGGDTRIMEASAAQTQRPAHADYSHYFAESDGRDAERLEGEPSASVLQLPHGVELRSSSRSRGGPLRADMFRVELIPSDHPLAAGALSEVVHIKVVHTAAAAAGTAASPATHGGDVPYPLLLRMRHDASAEQFGHLAFYRAETPDSEMQLVKGGCFWSDGYAEVEVTSFSVWKIALMAAAEDWLAVLNTYIDQHVGVAAFAPRNIDSPLTLKFVLHPENDIPLNDHYTGFCKVGEEFDVPVCRGKAVTVALMGRAELSVTFQPWKNKRQTQEIPGVVELRPSSSPPKAVISQPGVVPHQRVFSLPLLTSRASPAQLGLSTANAAAPPEVPSPKPSYDIFFSLRLNESMDEAEKLKAMIERTRPDVKCFLSGRGRNPNGTNIGIAIPTALKNAKMAIIMGSKTYGKKTESNCSTFEEMHYILRKKKPMFLLKMCEEWEELQTDITMGSHFLSRRWEDGQVTQALVDEILTRYNQANSPEPAELRAFKAIIKGIESHEREFSLPELTSRSLRPSRETSVDPNVSRASSLLDAPAASAIASAIAVPVASSLERIETKLAQIQLTQEKAIELLSAQSTMLATLLRNTHAAPKLILFLPAAQATGEGLGISWPMRALRPRDWFNIRLRIFFVDPLTYTVAKTHPNREGEAEGFELTFPRVWVAKAMPYVKLGLTVLKVAAAAGKLAGFPIPDLRSMIDSQLSTLDGLKEEAITNMCAMTKDEATARELLDAVDAKCQELLGEKVQELKLVDDGEPLKEKLKECIEKSAGELDELLSKEYPKWKDECGLELAVHKRSGACEWVLPEDKNKFEANGWDADVTSPDMPKPVASPVASSDMGASAAQTQRPALADYSHYFAEWDGRDAQGLEGDASASVVELPHGVELRSSSRSRGGPLRADMFSIELIPSEHPLATGALSETLHIIAHPAAAAARTAASPATHGGDVPYPLLLRMRHRASAEQLEQLAFYRAETLDSEMQLVEGGCFWSDGYAEVEVTSFSVWKVVARVAAAVGWARYIDRPVGVAAFAPSDPEAPRILRFVLHPKLDPPLNDHFYGFCKVGDDKEVAVRRGEAVTITLKDLLPELGVRFAPWRNTRQSEIIPRVLELEPSSSHPSLLMAVISQPGLVPHQREFPLMLPTAADAVPGARGSAGADSGASCVQTLLDAPAATSVATSGTASGVASAVAFAVASAVASAFAVPVARILERIEDKLAQIQLTQDRAIELLSAQSTMLATLLRDTHAAPKLILFLPVAEETGNGEGVSTWLKKALSPKDWLNHRVRIFFVDPLTYTVAETRPNDKGEAEGFELTFPKKWVVKAMPYVKLGLTALKVAAAAGKLTGFPVPDLRSMIDSQLSALGEFKEEAITNMCAMTKDEATARELLDAVDAKCQELLGEKVQELKLVDGEPLKECLELKKCLEKSAGELHELLSKEYPKWKDECGLELAVHTPGWGAAAPAAFTSPNIPKLAIVQIV
jgi:hypothetical protein